MTLMLTTDLFLLAAQGSGWATLALAGITLLSFILKWGLRFRLVGVTGFMGVLTTGLFALSLVPITRTEIPGAVRYTTVYDSGATQAVIAVPATITDDELEATLRQAASNLFSPGRVGTTDNQLTIRARSIVHPQPGLSQPLYLGEVKRSLYNREDDAMTVKINTKALAIANRSAQS